MEKILLIDSSQALTKHLKNSIESELTVHAKMANSLKEAEELVERNSFLLAVSGLVLQDALDGEVIDFLKEKNLPTIVLTGNTSVIKDKIKEANNIIHLNTKGGTDDAERIIKTIKSVRRNINYKALVLSEDEEFLKVIGSNFNRILIDHAYFKDSSAALLKFQESSDIKVVIIDDRIDFEVIKNLTREIKSSKKIVKIISAVSKFDATKLSELMKIGVDDYMVEAMEYSLFAYKIDNILECVDEVENSISKDKYDYMTSAYTLPYFYKLCKIPYLLAKKESVVTSMAVIGIDDLNIINKKYGYQAGNELIIKIARDILEVTDDETIATRFGGDTIALLDIGVDENKIYTLYEAFKKELESEPLLFEGEEIGFSVSIGITTYFDSSLENMVENAYSLMVKAKHDGKNRIVMDA